MRKTLLIGIALGFSVMGFAQKVQFEQAQSRIMEPIQDVFVRPMVAEMKMLSTELKVYMASWQFQEKKITDLTWQDLRDAKANAAFHAAISDGADVITTMPKIKQMLLRTIRKINCFTLNKKRL